MNRLRFLRNDVGHVQIGQSLRVMNSDQYTIISDVGDVVVFTRQIRVKGGLYKWTAFALDEELFVLLLLLLRQK